jgi:tRNA pseudouridine38-40 synthase
MAAGVRRSEGFRRYALSIQYNGISLLGFSYQGSLENKPGTVVGGVSSVEGRLMQALDRLLGSSECYENIQVSSRTDRGVHALKNTLHIDVKPPSIRRQEELEPMELLRGINHHLGRLENALDENSKNGQTSKRYTAPHLTQIRFLNAKFAPEKMYNPYSVQFTEQPEFIDWNARFSATSRTYAYRILLHERFEVHGLAYEWDRAWRVHTPLNIINMQEAAHHLVGQHDFSSFRAAGCKRFSPVVAIQDIQIHCQPYSVLGIPTDNSTQLVTIAITGHSFLYRQVRNMVGCLVTVGKGEVAPQEVKDILERKSRRHAPVMAPAHGLFLVDVQHGDFVI